MTEYAGVVRMVHFVNRLLIGEDNSITIRPDLNYFNFIPSRFVNRSPNLRLIKKYSHTSVYIIKSSDSSLCRKFCLQGSTGGSDVGDLKLVTIF